MMLAYAWIWVAVLFLLQACTNPADEHLWLASMRGDKQAMLDFIKGGADPNYVRGGWSILMRVARNGQADVAEILIEHGANVNFKGKDGASVLTIAAEHGNVPVAKVLLARGADVNIRNDHGNHGLDVRGGVWPSRDSPVVAQGGRRHKAARPGRRNRVDDSSAARPC